MKRVIAVCIAIALSVVCGCIATQKITKTYQDPSFVFGQIPPGTSVRVVVADNVDLRDFQNAFEKEYQSEQAFCGILCRQIGDSLKTILRCRAIPSDNPQEAATLADAGIDRDAMNRIQELLSTIREEYFVVITTVTIANRQVTTASMAMPGPGPHMGGGRSETAMVTLHVDLWNVREKKKVLIYSSLGESNVTMLFYGTALKNAMNEAVGNMVRYLETGLSR